MRNGKIESIQMWTKFDEKNPAHVPMIEEFGKLIESKFSSSFYENYCYKRKLIGKLSYRKEDGAYRGVREESQDGKYVPARMPYKFLEEESMWLAWQRMKDKTPRANVDLPF